jgi:hypothetical protein
VVFPTVADVGPADMDVNEASADLAHTTTTRCSGSPPPSRRRGSAAQSRRARRGSPSPDGPAAHASPDLVAPSQHGALRPGGSWDTALFSRLIPCGGAGTCHIRHTQATGWSRSRLRFRGCR